RPCLPGSGYYGLGLWPGDVPGRRDRRKRERGSLQASRAPVSSATTWLYHRRFHHARSHVRRVTASSAGARRGKYRGGRVRMLAVMAGKPPCSNAAPRLVKDLTCVLEVRTL